ncbi:MAG: sigma-70 family RNA polymerase sigma factor [Bacteroidales bacterium]|nr:sigma-70 family RNA polymerase sigma factor [Bacteroidales bacterium]MDD4822543.1 sigma-70 family RNA polymerase sigma factor [Bacteroidales bacterium]
MDKLVGLTDEELVVKYAEGINEAFDVLLNRYKSKLFSYIYFAVRDRDLADDIFQDTFVKAIMTIRQGRYTENGKFPAWITRIAHNLIIDYFRQEKSNNQISSEEAGFDLLNNPKYSDDNVEDRLIHDQIISDIKKLVMFLPENQQEVVIMRYYKNLSFKEIADSTGVSINTALGRMRYAILNLRRIAEEKQMILTMD